MISALLLLASATQPASFDCARAAGAAERAICTDPALGRADVVMAAAYRGALAALSPAGAATLRAEQRTFISYTERECQPGGLVFLSSGDGKPQTFAHCLLLAFEARGRGLASAVQVAGGWRFLTLRRDRAVHTPPPDDPNLPPVSSQWIQTIQVDAAQSPSEQAFNRAVTALIRRAARRPGFSPDREQPNGGASIEAELVAASPDAIAVEVTWSAYFGGAHPVTETATLVWSIPLGRPLTAADLFAAPGAPALRRLVSAYYDASSGKGHQGCDEPDLARSKFVVDGAGVRFSFDPYELGAYTCGGESEVLWTSLTPFLKRPPPFDPARLETPRPVDGRAPAG